MISRNSSTIPNVQQVFKNLQDDLLWLHAKWKIYRQLFAASEERIAILNDFAPDFFQVVHDGLIFDLLLTMSRMTDPAKTRSKENLTLDRLMSMLRKPGSEKLPKELRIKVEAVKQSCHPFRDIRNRQLAHTDLGTALEYHPDPLPGISREMVEHALTAFRHLFESIDRYLGNAETNYNDVPLRGDGDTIIRYLKESKAYRKHKLHGRVDPVEDGL